MSWNPIPPSARVSTASAEQDWEPVRPQEGVWDLCCCMYVLFSNWASFTSAQFTHRHVPSLFCLCTIPFPPADTGTFKNFCWAIRALVCSALAPILNQHLLPSYNTGTDLIQTRPIVSHHLAWHLSVTLGQGMWYQADKKQHRALPGEPLCSSKPPLLLL